MLEVESGISPETIHERGYFTAVEPAKLQDLGFADYQLRVPVLVVPMYGPAGSVVNYQIRPDEPRLNEVGKPIRYETPSNSQIVLDCHPSNAMRLKDPQVPLWITEGVRKGDSGATRGLVVVALQGVWCWQRGGNPLPEWKQIPLANRTVYVAFDADIVHKPPVRQALAGLVEYLWERRALVYVVPLEKIGEVRDD
jgi:Domain of unknown function (DUF3854)